MGGDAHGHGGEKFKIPDWKQYKVDGIKELEWTQKALEAKGLRDPWLRRVLHIIKLVIMTLAGTQGHVKKFRVYLFVICELSVR